MKQADALIGLTERLVKRVKESSRLFFEEDVRFALQPDRVEDY